MFYCVNYIAILVVSLHFLRANIVKHAHTQAIIDRKSFVYFLVICKVNATLQRVLFLQFYIDWHFQFSFNFEITRFYIVIDDIPSKSDSVVGIDIIIVILFHIIIINPRIDIVILFAKISIDSILVLAGNEGRVEKHCLIDIGIPPQAICIISSIKSKFFYNY